MYGLLIRVVLLCSFGLAFSLERKLTVTLNPGCYLDCKKMSGFVIHIRADGPSDTLHYLWDFTRKPTALIALTPPISSLDINWRDFLSDASYSSIEFLPPPSYMFSFIIDEIIEFNDVNDTGKLNEKITDSGYLNIVEMNDLEWGLVSLNNDSDTASIIAAATSPDHKGEIRIMLSAYGTSDHSEILPHLLHTSNSFQVDVILDNFPVSHPTSRYAVKMVTISSESANVPATFHVYKTINDEHSPGIFTVNEVLTSKNGGGYLQWKTVVYTSPNHTMKDSTLTHHNQIYPENYHKAEDTAVFALFGPTLQDMAVHSFNISMGTHGDGFYNKTNYTSWTLLAGVGKPVEEQFSTLILAVLLLGLGLPAILIIIGICCIVVRRFSNNANDIFLSQ